MRHRLPAIAALSLGLISGCSHRLDTESVRRELHNLEPLEKTKRITNQPVELAKLPMEPKDEVFQSAQKVFATTPGAAQVLTMTLDDVRASALTNNLTLQVDRISAGIAEELATAEAWKFEPLLAAAITYTQGRDTNRDAARTTLFEPSISIPTHLGGSVVLSYPHSVYDSDKIVASIPGMPPLREGQTITTGPKIALRQPLLRLGGLKVTYASVENAGLRARQADARTKLSAIRVLALAEQTYWRYYASYEALRIQLEKYERAKDQLRFAKRLVEEGARTKVEVTRAEAGVAREFDGVILAELQRRQGERALKRIVNLKEAPVGSTVVVQPATGPGPLQLQFDREALMRLAFEKRMDLFENELQVAIDENNADVAWNLALPGVGFEFNYYFAGSRPSFDDAVSDAFSKSSDVYSAGLFIDLPLLLDRAGWARHRQALLSLKQTRAFRRDLELAVSEEVLNAVDSVELSWQRVLATRQSLALAAEAYEAEKVQFGYGSITTTELLFQLDAYAAAKLAFMRAQSDYQNALVDLAFATGTILNETGVVWTTDRDAG